MSQTVLGSISLGYQPLWGQQRQIAGILLFVAPNEDSHIDAEHLLSTLKASWPQQAPQLMLSVQSPTLLQDLLAHGPTDVAWIQMPHTWLADPALAQLTHQAQQRGMTLVWQGEPGQRPSAALARCFARTMVTLTPDEAGIAMRIALGHTPGHLPEPPAELNSPVTAEQIYEGVASRVLADHCLDEQGAWGLAGWPADDVLHSLHHQLLQPSHDSIIKLVAAIDDDASIEEIEHSLSEEPILAYRFLRYANSAAIDLRKEIETLRQGLMVLGYTRIRNWLLEQLPTASDEIDLVPIRSAMVLRARLMEHLLDAGEEGALSREVYMCGLFSQIDILLGEPLDTALQRLTLPERTLSALLERTGPYVPYLDIAAAMETPDTQVVGQLCQEHDLNIEDMNRALLRTLTTFQLRSDQAKPLR